MIKNIIITEIVGKHVKEEDLKERDLEKINYILLQKQVFLLLKLVRLYNNYEINCSKSTYEKSANK